MNGSGNSTSHGYSRQHRQAGVTLMELMIVVVIVGILAGVALAVYIEIVNKAKRTEAKILLHQAAARQERYYFENNQYTTTAADLGYSPATDSCPQSTNPCSEEQSYELTMAAGATGSITTSYALSVTPLAPHKDSDCGSLTLDSRWTKSSSTGAAKCWAK